MFQGKGCLCFPWTSCTTYAGDISGWGLNPVQESYLEKRVDTSLEKVVTQHWMLRGSTRYRLDEIHLPTLNKHPESERYLNRKLFQRTQESVPWEEESALNVCQFLKTIHQLMEIENRQCIFIPFIGSPSFKLCPRQTRCNPLGKQDSQISGLAI